MATAPNVQLLNQTRVTIANGFQFRHFPQLDGLRGLAVLLVIAGHILEFEFHIHTDFGGLGVLLFFVLSGFLITGLLDVEKTKSGAISIREFYVRRALRLFPALMAFLAVMAILIYKRVVTDTPWYTILACVVYVRNIWGRGSLTGHLWSLSLEEQFYSIWPWCMALLSRANALRIAICSVVIITAFRTLAIHLRWFNYQSGVYYLHPMFRFDSILLGCVIALLLVGTTEYRWHVGWLSSSITPVILWPTVLVWSIIGETWTQAWYLTIQMLLASMTFVHVLLAERAAYVKVFSSKYAAWIGRLSYSWYLWQQLFTVMPYPQWGGLRVFPFNVVASLAIASISFFVIEQPFLKLKERHAFKRPGTLNNLEIGPA
jgi:peptidoglycan/LPS O-acetylase OafA/YrhL